VDENVNSCPVQFPGLTSLFLNLHFFCILLFIMSIYMIEYLKNMILVQNRTLFHVRKVRENAESKKIAKIAKIGLKKTFMEPRVAQGRTKNHQLKLFN
jgi:hypothetical protein